MTVSAGVRRAARLTWQVTVVGLVILAAWHFIDFTEVWSTLKDVRTEWLTLLLVLATVDRFLMALKWHQLLLHAGSKAPFIAVLSAYYQAAFVQRFLPSSMGGDALRAMVISREFGGTTGVLASMVVEKLVAMLAAVLIALCGAAMILTEPHDRSVDLMLVTIPGLLVLMLVLLRLSMHQAIAMRVIGWMPGQKVKRVLRDIYGEYAAFGQVPRTLLVNFIYCLVEQLLQVALLLCCALALGVDATPFRIVAAVSIAQCLRKFAILLEGWMLGEFTAVLIYSLLGIPGAQALAFSLLGHATGIVATTPGAALVLRSTARFGGSRSQSASSDRSPGP